MLADQSPVEFSHWSPFFSLSSSEPHRCTSSPATSRAHRSKPTPPRDSSSPPRSVLTGADQIESAGRATDEPPEYRHRRPSLSSIALKKKDARHMHAVDPRSDG